LKKAKIISSILGAVGMLMISIAMVLQNENTMTSMSYIADYKEFDIKNMAASANVIVKEETTPVIKDTSSENKSATDNNNTLALTEVSMETAPASVIVPPRVEVYEGMTIEELSAKLDLSLGNGYIAGKGGVIASYCLEKGVDPYIAVAIMLHETGCKHNCSSLTRRCNNVGGQKGSPGCNGGAYKAYATLDEGIVGFIDNLYKNYYSKGLTTVERIAPRYAQSSAWPARVNAYIESIRAT